MLLDIAECDEPPLRCLAPHFQVIVASRPRRLSEEESYTITEELAPRKSSGQPSNRPI
jgi:hypothetical protein